MIDFKRIQEIEKIKVEVCGKDYIPYHRGNYNIIAGDGGVGKSLVALKMLVHFLMEKPQEQALGIFSEDTREQIEERLKYIVGGLNITLEEVFNRTFFKTLDNDDGRVFAYMDGRIPTLDLEYFTQVVSNIQHYNVGFIVFDPLERFHTGLNESDAGDMKFLVTSIFQKIGTMTGSCVIVLHHTSKGDKSGARGSSVITNKGRVAYNLRRNIKKDVETGIEKPLVGWEKSILLTTIKDNHYISGDCEIIQNKDGKLTLPVKTSIDYIVEEHEYKMEIPYV